MELLEPIPRETLDKVRETLTELNPDVLAVFVMLGSEEKGQLALVCSSELDEDETWRLLLHSVVDEPIVAGWIEDHE